MQVNKINKKQELYKLLVLAEKMGIWKKPCVLLVWGNLYFINKNEVAFESFLLRFAILLHKRSLAAFFPLKEKQQNLTRD